MASGKTGDLATVKHLTESVCICVYVEQIQASSKFARISWLGMTDVVQQIQRRLPSQKSPIAIGALHG